MTRQYAVAILSVTFASAAGCVRADPASVVESPAAVAAPSVVQAPPVVTAPAQGEHLTPKVLAAGDDEPAAPGAGGFRDERDGQSYRVVKMGDRFWFAENLRFSCPGSWCYEERPSSCAQFGRLYQWDAAVKACPRGWHLPSEDEWQAVEDLAPNTLEPLLPGGATGFDILMGGERRTDGRYQDLGDHFYFWSSTTLEGRARLRWNLADSGLQIATDVKTEGYSVRCIQDG